MTARATFPPAVCHAVRARPENPTENPTDNLTGSQGAEAHLATAALRLWQGGTLAQADAAARLRAAFGAGPGNAVVVALDRLWSLLQDTPPQDTIPDALARLVAATLDGTDAEDMTRHMALGLVPAHRMEPLVIAARGLALALRRAVLIAAGPAPGCPVRHG